MEVQINTSNAVKGSAKLSSRVEATVRGTLDHLSQHITRVEVHLSAEDSGKSGASPMRCVMEARLEGREPTAVSEDAATLDEAVEGAAEKLRRVLIRTVEKMRGR